MAYSPCCIKNFVDTNMFLSIIIPHYNLPKELLERCLKSITSQGLPDHEYEIIVVDDGSDTPPSWVAELSENIIFIAAEHSGPGGARNRGIEVAKGQYIMFVDADDYLLDNGEIHPCIEKLKTEKPHILRYGYFVKKDEETPEFRQRKKIRFSNTISGASFMSDNNLSGSSCTFFFSRELAIKKGTKFPTDIFHEDEEFNTLLHYHAQTLIDSNATLYCYCTRPGSTTANSSKDFETRRIADMLNIIGRISDFSSAESNKSNTIQKRAIAHKLDMLTVDAILNMMYVGMTSKEIVRHCNTALAPHSLYPLRKARHSLKYIIFRTIANSNMGMKLLRILIPKKKPAKK